MGGLSSIGPSALVNASAPALDAPKPTDSPQKIAEAAEQFEAVMIEQLFKQVRESSGGWMGSEDDAGKSMLEYAEQEIARVISKSGGFGLAKMISTSLAARPGAEAAVQKSLAAPTQRTTR